MNGLDYINHLSEWKGDGNFTLQKISKVLAVLGNPQDKVKCVHVAGTNGKGSVCAAIASILGQTGLRVGLTVSPHLAKINERIVIDGLPISDETLSIFALKVKEAQEQTGEKLSFFEGITAIAFLTFAETKVDWMVIEVGLGGRLDATNVINSPKISVITSVDFDHQDILGKTLEEIAKEKAGIIKENGKVFVGEVHKTVLAEIDKISKAKGVSTKIFGVDFKVLELGAIRPVFKGWKSDSFEFLPSLPGLHQVKNMALAIAVCLELGISEKNCAAGVKEVFWPGRLETAFLGTRKVYFDCAHNEAGAKSLAQFLKDNNLYELDIAFGALDKKNWQAMVNCLFPYAKKWCLLSPHSSRALDSKFLESFIKERGGEIANYGINYDLFIKEMEKGKVPLLITGSIYLVGALRSMIVKEEKPIWKRT